VLTLASYCQSCWWCMFRQIRGNKWCHD